jgi:hypothetical protein
MERRRREEIKQRGISDLPEKRRRILETSC